MKRKFRVLEEEGVFFVQMNLGVLFNDWRTLGKYSTLEKAQIEILSLGYPSKEANVVWETEIGPDI